jgi:osomolarity two-component system response regulator SSK1
MQALIDFDGWRKWKDFSAKEDEVNTAAAAKKASLAKKKKNRSSFGAASATAGATIREEDGEGSGANA